MWPQRVASLLIAVLSGLAAATACVAAVFYVPIIVLFGRDDPNESLTAYLLAIATPVIAAALIAAGAVLSFRLLHRRRYFAASTLAVVLFALVSYAAIRLRPH
jgi:Na+-driven multidrug efflux pump